ncbi:GAP family protein [Hoyosella sp. YIM 151337]|uniref:GAP family protein n=1 Tax=Hoyosella sp. YIM 151337 TaxID=2992742 RepID=UPI0022354CF0|nr:GAP family protein [Hoyosella sp. YIM 151337]MCW4354853.1 GAP family protein [Hoyosella sp. YIM 151337]
MTTLLLALMGLAFLDSLDVLLVGATAAIVYDARLARRSPVPGVSAFLLGVFVMTTAFGVLTVLGLSYLTELFDIAITPTVRYWVGLVVGLILIVVALLPTSQRPPPDWAVRLRRNPALLVGAGALIGMAQAPTAVPYLAGLAMLTAHQPLPAWWPFIIIAYCLVALIPPAVVLFLATRRSPAARRRYRSVVRVLTRYGPRTVRIIFIVAGAVLIIDALMHHQYLV